MSRRTFLEWAGVAAAGAALGAWELWPRPDPSELDSTALARIQGRIVGPSVGLGHLLRFGVPPLAPPSRVVRTRTVIVGSGIAGMSCAWALARAGWDDFVLLDMEAEAGGTSGWVDYPASSAPWGAHYLPVPTRQSQAVRVLLEELGVIVGHGPKGSPIYREEYLCQAPQERLYTQGDWFDGLYPRLTATKKDLAELEDFHRDMEQWRGLKTRDGRRPFAIPRAYASRDPRLLALDEISMAEYMDRKGWTSPRLRWFVGYACRDDYGCKLEHTSAWAGIHYWTARGKSTKTAEQSISETDDLLTWPEGNGWLARRLKQKAGARVHTSLMALRLRQEGSQVQVDALDRQSGQVVRIEASEAVVAVPRFIAAKLMAEYGHERAKAVAAFSYAPWLVSNVILDREPVNRQVGGQALCWDNVIHDSDTLGYVVATHQSLRTTNGPTVLTHYIPLTGSAPAVTRNWALYVSWASWRDRVLADLAVPHPGIEHMTSRLDVMLWGHAMVRPTPGFVWSAAREEAGRPFGLVRFAHTDLAGLAIFEEAHYHGVQAAEDIMRAAGHRFEKLL